MNDASGQTQSTASKSWSALSHLTESKWHFTDRLFGSSSFFRMRTLWFYFTLCWKAACVMKLDETAWLWVGVRFVLYRWGWRAGKVFPHSHASPCSLLNIYSSFCSQRLDAPKLANSSSFWMLMWYSFCMRNLAGGYTTSDVSIQTLRSTTTCFKLFSTDCRHNICSKQMHNYHFNVFRLAYKTCPTNVWSSVQFTML